MDDAEVDIVATELAKIGGTSWYPGRENGSILRVVTSRYRDRARAAIAALDRYRASQARSEQSRGNDSGDGDSHKGSGTAAGGIRVGATVVYRPPGERRAYPCTIEKISDDFIYLVPQISSRIGWVPASEILTNVNFMKDLQDEQEALGQPGGSVPEIRRSPTE